MPAARRFKLSLNRLRLRKEAVKAETLQSRLTRLKDAPLISLDNVIRSRPTRSRDDIIQESEGKVNSLPWSVLQPYDGTPRPAPSRLRPRTNRSRVPALKPTIASPIISRPFRPSTSGASTGRLTGLNLRFPEDFSSIPNVRKVLGITSDTTRSPLIRDVIFVAVDTEFRREGFFDRAVEVGISILDTRDLRGVGPGAYLADWVQRMQHQSIILDCTRRREARRLRSLFSNSEFMTLEGTKQAIRRTLSSAVAKQHLVPPSTAGEIHDCRPRPVVVLVGQSITKDIQVLRRDQIDILDPSDTGVHFDTVIDTEHPSRTLPHFRNSIPSAKLGMMLRSLGGNPAYHAGATEGRTMKGVHHAGNDAAYTMMALLLFVLRWDEVARGSGLEILAHDHPLWKRALLAPRGEELSTLREVPTITSWWAGGWYLLTRLLLLARSSIDGKI